MKKQLFFGIVSLFAGLALILTGAVSTASAALDDGLVAHYPFEGSDNTLEDASGMGNNGDIGSAQRVDDGKFGKAIRFANNTDSASAPGSESLTFEGDLTVAAWIHPEALSTGDTWPDFENRVIFTGQLNLDVLHAKGRFEIKKMRMTRLGSEHLRWEANWGWENGTTFWELMTLTRNWHHTMLTAS